MWFLYQYELDMFYARRRVRKLGQFMPGAGAHIA